MVEHSRLRIERRDRSSALHRHAVLAPIAARVFGELGIGASLWHRGHWLDIHERVGVAAFELEHGLDTERFAYNECCLAEVIDTKESVLGRHAGFADLFVPIAIDGRTDSVFVAGQFATERPTSGDVLERWRLLTGRPGHLSDPEFSHYLSTTLDTLTLRAEQVAALQRLGECFAAMMSSKGSAQEIYVELEALRDELLEARLADRMWEAARAMVGENTSRMWRALSSDAHRKELGLTRFPEHALVALFVSRKRDSAPVDELMLCDAFRRACVALARTTGNVVTGRVGDNGVSFLMAGRGAAQRSHARLLDLGQRAASLAHRRFGLALHLGLGAPAAPLSVQYQGALSAAHAALCRDVPVVEATASAPAPDSLSRHRQELARLAEDQAQALPTRFDQFLDEAAARCVYRLEPTRAHVEAGFERITEVFVKSGDLEPKSLAALRSLLDRAAGEAATMRELFAVYRGALRDVIATRHKAPGATRQDRNLQRAEEYVRQHYREPLTLQKVARVAGFAPTYFSELFHKEHGTTFGQYLTRLRIERAKTLLSDTPLGLQRIAELSGFATRRYLGRVFKSATRETPIGYRKRAQRGGTP